MLKVAVIHITRAHKLTTTELQAKINALAIELEQQYQLMSEWDENCLFFRRKGASGSIEINDQQLELNLTLGSLFKVAKSKIEREIIAMLDKQLPVI